MATHRLMPIGRGMIAVVLTSGAILGTHPGTTAATIPGMTAIGTIHGTILLGITAGMIPGIVPIIIMVGDGAAITAHGTIVPIIT